MSSSIDFSTVPGQSKLFVDFLAQETAIHSRFNSTPLTESKHADRVTVAEAIRRSMQCVELSHEQELMLEQFTQGATTVVTGQQVGFLGGPLYTLFKIQTAIHLSAQMSRGGSQVPSVRSQKSESRSMMFDSGSQMADAGSQMSDVQTLSSDISTFVVPVFWLEDNDHDAKEAGVASLPAKELGAYEVTAGDAVESILRRPVSDLSFDEGITERMANLLAVMPDSVHKADVEKLLRKTYNSGRKWNDAFVVLLQEIFAADGLLILKASVVREMGLMAEIIRHDLQHPGLLERLVLEASDDLTSHGYHVQAKPSPLNLFVHVDSQRHKINNVPGEKNNYTAGSLLYSHDELQRKINSAPERFSPSVLLRPIVQDYVLGTHTYVAGPGEIAYLAQLKEAYAAYGVPMPQCAARSSATILPRRIARFMEKQQLEFGYFTRPWQEVEKETLHTLHGTEIAERIDTAKTEMNSILENLKATVKTVDATLEASVGAASRAMEKEFETISKKVNAALKRRAEQSFGKYREAAACIFPDGTLQERSISPIFLLGESGINGTRALLAQLAALPRDKHHILELGTEG